MAKKYVSKTGDYLFLQQDDEGMWRVRWHVYLNGEDIGACLGQELILSTEPPQHMVAWEAWQADRCVANFADGRDEEGFWFKTKKKAQSAMKAANEGLSSGKPPWPNWALQAKAAGWLPPKGWKP